MTDYIKNLNKLESNPNILLLKEYPQHCCTTRFDHCNDVAVESYRMAKALHLDVDEKSLMRGAMLHDYYLYDTGSCELSARDHWKHHPETALENAESLYDLNDKERGIIVSHMWPINLQHVPDSKEGWLVCIADKVCAVREVVRMRVLHKEAIPA